MNNFGVNRQPSGSAIDRRMLLIRVKVVLYIFNKVRKVYYRVIFEEYMAPLILDKEEKGDDTDDHGAGNEDDDDKATVHHSSEVTKIDCF
jgi:hypothetical protein